jgi:hypothetical protein
MAANEAVFLKHSDAGTEIIHAQGLAPSGSIVSPLDDPSILWSNYLEWPIYTSTANAQDGYVFAGTYLNEPKEAELFAPDGGGVPAWVYPGTEFYVDASDDAFILGALDEYAGGVNVIKWTGPGSGTPDWTASFPGLNVSSYGPYIAVSADGSTISALLNNSGTTELIMFDAASSTPLVDYYATGLSFPRSSALSTDGRYAGFRTNTHVAVYDRDLNALRESIFTGFGAAPFDLSGDADLMVYGWSPMEVRQWTGAAYSPLWTHSEGGYYLSTVSISQDGSTVIGGWYNSSFTSAKVTVHDGATGAVAWTYTFPTSSGLYQESIRRIEMTPDGSYFIVGSFGDAANLNPEVHVFDRDAGPTPYFTFDMPGSVFDVDISADGAYASACGKHVHANVSGHGGDIVAIDMDLTTPNLVVTMTPYNPPIVIPAWGGSFDFNIELSNLNPDPNTFDAWIMVTLPDCTVYGPVLGPVNLTLPGNQAINRDRTQNVPEGAPAGFYTYAAYAGEYPNTIWAEDSFQFEKQLWTEGAGNPVSDWLNDGEPFEKVTEVGSPTDFALLGCYPNPFNPVTAISYQLSAVSHVNLSVYDISGRLVTELVNGWRDTGSHEVTLDASSISSGIYIYRLTAADFTASGKMVLMK